MNKSTHVYCADCVYGKELIASLYGYNQEPIPKTCCSCYPFDPEDSEPFEIRPKYVAIENMAVDPEIQAKFQKSKRTFLDEGVFEIVWNNFKNFIRQFK